MKTYKKYQKLLSKIIILVLLYQYTFQTFEGEDILQNKIPQPDSKVLDNFKLGYGDLSVITGSNFGTSYIGSDKNVYAYFMNKGTNLFTPIQMNESITGQTLWTSTCSVNDYMLVVYTILNTGRQVYGNFLSKTGVKVHSEFSIQRDEDHHLYGCTQANSNNVLIYYADRRIGGFVYYAMTIVAYDLVNETVGSKVFMSDNTAWGYGTHRSVKLKGSNSNIVISHFNNISETPADHGIYIQQYDCTTLQRVTGQTNQQILNSNSVLFDTGIIQPTNDGGFIYIYSVISKIVLLRFNASFVQTNTLDLKTDPIAGIFRTNFIVIGNTAYILYMNPARTKLNIMEVNTGTCQITKDDVEIYSGTNITYFSLEVTPDSQKTRVIGILVTDENGTPNAAKTYYYEYFFDQLSVCTVPNCDKCFQGETICYQCLGSSLAEKSIRLRSDTSLCTCDDGYYHDSSFTDCQTCVDKCGTCSGSNSNCHTCKYTDPNLLTAPDCVCKPGYIPNGSNGCDQCDPTTCVLSCSGTTTNCDVCKDTYVKIGSVCQSCTSPCKNCTTDQTTCTSCIDGYYKSGNSCIVCPHPYTKCSDATTPTECKTGTGRLGTSDNCGCDSGFFEKNTDDCGQCTFPCLTCQTTALTCTGTCDGQAALRTSPECDCNDGYYEDSLTCIQCPDKFKKCSNNTTATECHTDAVGRSTSLPCSCTDGYYPDGSNKDCLECHDRCQTCSTNPTSCGQCKYTDPNLQTAPDCTCKSGWIDDGSNGCEQCDSTCVFSCTGSKFNCDECQDGYFKQGNICVQCPHPFSKCSNETTPTECKSGLGRLGLSDNCICQPGYYEKDTDDCGLCQYPCTLCNGSPTNCISCNDRQCGTCKLNSSECEISCNPTCTRCREDGSCISCKIEEFLNPTSQKCENCNPKCEICDKTNKNTCIECKNEGIGRSKDLEQNCKCLDGYYEDENSLDCVKCQSNSCKSCDQNGICLECFNSNLLPPNCTSPKKGKIISQVIDPNGNLSSIEETCSLKCETCTISKDNCESCAIGNNRSPQKPCNCLEGYHDNQNTQINCQKCPKYCKKCIDDKICLECDTNVNRIVNPLTQHCECKNGFKENSSFECQRCYQYQDQCFSQCPKNTIPDNQHYYCHEQSYNIESISSIIWISTSIILVITFISNGFALKSRKFEFTEQNNEQKPDLQA